MNSTITNYYYDGDSLNVLYETNGNNEIVRSYVYSESDQLLAMRKGNDTFFYHYNAHGDVIALTNQQGEVVARYEYDAWGNPITVEEDSSVADNPFRYAGYQYDRETGMYYLIARYYHPEHGVFLSLDPDPGDDDDILSQNGYTYVNNNPVMLVDPDGHLFWVVVNGGFAIYDSYKAYKAGKGFWGILGAGASGLIGVGKLKAGYKLVKTAKGVKTVKTTKGKKKKKACNCFTAGTKVLTDEGEKNIENIKVGDKVLTKDEFDENGELAYKEVTALYTNYRNDIIKLYIGDLLIETTDNHPFWVEGRGWVFADELKAGDKLQKADGSTLVIDKVEFVLLDVPVKVYNFTVEDYHTYYVTDLGIWVHNTNCFKLPKTVKSNKGVTGSFSVKGYTYRIDTNKTAPGEGGFHIHIYRNGKEVAKVSGTGSWAKSHNSKTLLKPSQIDKTVRTEVNRLIRHVQKRL